MLKTGPTTAIAGNQITYTVAIGNPGPGDAQGVSLADTLPAGTTFVNQTQGNTGPQFTLSNTGNAITDTLATLAAGATQTITITAAINANTPAGTLSNAATATALFTRRRPQHRPRHLDRNHHRPPGRRHRAQDRPDQRHRRQPDHLHRRHQQPGPSDAQT